MNKKELCFHSWHGEPGKEKHFLSHYCKEGFTYNSKTNERRLDLPRCQDWFGDWNGGCCDLKERKMRSWAPRRRKLI